MARKCFFGFPVALVVVALAVACLTPALAANKMTISITKKAITVSPSAPASGDYTVAIKNMTATPRGVEMTGVDRGGSPFVRYSKVLPKGKSETFAWFFPSDESVYVRELLSCVHKSRSCVVATFGSMMARVRVK